MADLLTAQDIKSWLKKLPNWDHDKKHIERLFEFDDFSQAIEFVNGVAEIAEEDDHHPEIEIRDSKVTLRLSTHSAGRRVISQPTPLRIILSALAALALAVAVWWLVEWRSAPPPPPKVEMPGR